MSAIDFRTNDFARTVVETVRTPLLVLDGSGRVVSANPAFYTSFQLEAGEVLGTSFFEIAGGQWDLPALRIPLEDVLAGTTEISDMRVEARLEKLGRRAVLVNARHGASPEGDDVAVVSIEDVTERDRAQREIRRYAQKLERSNRDLEDFAHAASHDLQEPLRKIRTYAERLTSILDPATLDERTRRYLERMPDATERLQQRIDDLLQLARVGRSEPQRSPTDLQDVVTDVLDDLEPVLDETGGQVEVGDLPVLDVDPTQIRILFQNLLSNALKYRKEDTRPKISIFCEPPPDGGQATESTVVVEDHGIGFEEEYAERIFGPFQRLHGREAYPGSGVGLALCRRIVEHHHGRIEAEGRPGRGARFLITLPFHAPDEEETV